MRKRKREGFYVHIRDEALSCVDCGAEIAKDGIYAYSAAGGIICEKCGDAALAAVGANETEGSANADDGAASN